MWDNTEFNKQKIGVILFFNSMTQKNVEDMYIFI